MTHLPQLHDELVRAAREHFPAQPTRRRFGRARRSVVLAVAVSLGSVASAGAVLVASGVVGGDPSTTVPRVGGEERSGMTRTRAPRVLAVADLPQTGPIELIGYRMRGYGGRGELLCLDVAQASGSRAGGCDRDLPGRAAGLLGTRAGGVTGPRLAVGATSDDAVASVDVRYRRDGRDEVVRALVMPVEQRLAEEVGSSAFLYYVAELPNDATGAVVVARDSGGNDLWRAAFAV